MVNRLSYILSTLQDIDGYRQGKGATGKSITAAEKTLSVTFPNTLKQFFTTTGWASCHSFGLFGLGKDVPYDLNLVSITKLWQSLPASAGLPQGVVPLTGIIGVNAACMDLRVDSPSHGKVLFYNYATAKLPVQPMVWGDYLDWMWWEVCAALEEQQGIELDV